MKLKYGKCEITWWEKRMVMWLHKHWSWVQVYIHLWVIFSPLNDLLKKKEYDTWGWDANPEWLGTWLVDELEGWTFYCANLKKGEKRKKSTHTKLCWGGSQQRNRINNNVECSATFLEDNHFHRRGMYLCDAWCSLISLQHFLFLVSCGCFLVVKQKSNNVECSETFLENKDVLGFGTTN